MAEEKVEKKREMRNRATIVGKTCSNKGNWLMVVVTTLSDHLTITNFSGRGVDIGHKSGASVRLSLQFGSELGQAPPMKIFLAQVEHISAI